MFNKKKFNNIGDKPFLLYDKSYTNANVFYSTNLLVTDSFIFLYTGKKRVILIGDMEVDRARIESDVDEVLGYGELNYGDFIKEYPDRNKAFAMMVGKLLEMYNIKEINIPPRFPVFLAQGLESVAGIKVKIDSDILVKERLCKNEYEIASIRETQQALELGMTAAEEVVADSSIRDGILYYNGEMLTSEYLKFVIDCELLKKGCHSEDIIVASGIKSCEPHYTGTGPVYAKVPIIFDIFPFNTKTRFFSDQTRTLCKGKTDEKLKKFYTQVYDAQMRGIEMIKPGVATKDVHNEVAIELSSFGHPIIGGATSCKEGFIHGTGHGVGLAVHEGPAVNHVSKEILEEGMVITVEPGVYYKKLGGIRLEDLVLVTSDGYENLTKYKKVFEID